MKKIVVILLLIISAKGNSQFKESMFAKDPIINLENFQKQKIYYGYFLGFNSFDFKVDYRTVGSDILVKKTTGFNVGVVGDLKLQEYINLRFEPGLYYTQRDLTFPGFTKKVDVLREVSSTYIHFPLLLKFSSLRTGNIRPYLVGGVSATLNLSSNSKSIDDNYEQTFSPSIRGVFGINDELIRDNNPNSPWTGNIESLKTRAVLINFTFH